jgi:hypothetical protein
MRVPSNRSWIRSAGAGVVASVLMIHAGLPLFAQSPLGDLAKKEQERRKTVKAAGKVYSNKDLPTPPAQSAPDPAALPPPTPAPDAKADAQKPEAKDERDEAWWRSRMAQAQEAQRRGEAFAEALQSRINSLSTDAVNRDDPYQRAKAAEDRQKAMSELARVTGEIDTAKKEIAATEEEARQAGVPPGWLR